MVEKLALHTATRRIESERENKKKMPTVDVTTTVWGMEYSVHGACAIATVQTD